jgi:hypothetical protein
MRGLPRAALACATCLGTLAIVPAARAVQADPENGSLAFAAKRAAKPVIYLRIDCGSRFASDRLS